MSVIINVKEDIKKYTEREFAPFKNRKNRVEGFIAENTVKDWYGAELTRYGKHSMADIILNHVGIDIKNDICDMKYFDCSRSYFTVQDRQDGKHCPVYMFTKYDPKAGKVAIVGWLKYEDVIRNGVRYEKGDVMEEYHWKTSHIGCYVISQMYLNEFEDNRSKVYSVE